MISPIPECPICKGVCKPTEESYSIGEIFQCWKEYGTGYPFSRAVFAEYDLDATTRLHLCPDCEFGIFIPAILGSDLFYQELSRMGESWYYLSDKWEYRWALSIVRSCTRVLDIGCGEGFFLERCREKGISAEGIELNSSAAQIARTKGFAVHEESLEVFERSNRERFDAVCLFQVLEHVADPLDVFGNALACVKTGGILIVGVPNASGLMG
jgi:SAM-dependent methyltransferase